MIIDVDSLRALGTDESIIITSHASEQLIKRKIKYKHIKMAIISGEIIEEYPDEFPDPRILILGYTEDRKTLHIVIGVSDWVLRIITVYYPTLAKWENDYKTRKAVC
jgi:uncharacterized DUF497 family protein